MNARYLRLWRIANLRADAKPHALRPLRPSRGEPADEGLLEVMRAEFVCE